ASSGELVVDGAITANKISAGSVTANAIAAGAVVASKIAAGTITADKMAVGTITAESGIIDALAITNSMIVDGAVSRRTFISRWSSLLITASTKATAQQLGSDSNFDPADYVGDSDSPDNPALITITLDYGPSSATAGRLTFTFDLWDGSSWISQAVTGVSFPATGDGGYATLRLVGALIHGHTPFAGGLWRMRAYKQPGSPDIYVQSVVCTFEQVNK
ncbi:polymer-forming cytoskeletal protein, partial [Pseudorhodobacter sp.]|uniref:polymer-forming cytoskeletal protein n=1 Tax=Pseudorhodobacter sp. TaxID=1934400 RepID=UPI002647899D